MKSLVAVVLLLALQISTVFGALVLRDANTLCAHPGDAIMDKTECETAANTLGYTGETAVEISHSGNPAGCQWNTASRRLYLNNLGTHVKGPHQPLSKPICDTARSAGRSSPLPSPPSPRGRERERDRKKGVLARKKKISSASFFFRFSFFVFRFQKKKKKKLKFPPQKKARSTVRATG